jgi:hypothetical protein
MCSARLEKRRKVWDSILFGCLVLSFLGAAVQLRRFWEQNTTDRDGFIRGTELQAPKHHSHYQVGFLQAIMPFSPAVRAESHPLLHQRAELEAYDDGDDDMDEYDVSD